MFRCKIKLLFKVVKSSFEVKVLYVDTAVTSHPYNNYVASFTHAPVLLNN